MNQYRIDFSCIDTAQTFHRILAKELSLPDWYGENLDALFDCLTELENPVCLIMENWDDGVSFAEGFRGAFEDAQAENPNFSVVFE